MPFGRITRRNRRTNRRIARKTGIRRRRGYRSRRVSKYGKQRIVYNSGIVRSPLPMEYMCKFVASAFMYSAVGAGSGDYIFNFKMNSLYLPFQNAVASGVTYNTINVATYQCPGYSTLLNANCYTKYIVQSVKIEFDVIPQNILDNTTACIVCSHTGSVPANVASAMSRPWCTQMEFTTGRTYKLGDYPMKMYVPIHKYLGIPKLLYKYDQSGQWMGTYNSDAANTLELVTLVETGDNQVVTSALEFRVRITYYVLLKDLVTESLP